MVPYDSRLAPSNVHRYDAVRCCRKNATIAVVNCLWDAPRRYLA